jgi:hypothetical protein
MRTQVITDELREDLNVSSGNIGGGSESSKKKVSLKEFWARQKAKEEQKLRNLERIKLYAETDQRTPQLNPRSLQLATKQRPGDFMSRLQQNVERIVQRQEELEHKRETLHPECTFAPHINTKSKVLTPRSIDDMSRGDLLKLETKRVCDGQRSERGGGWGVVQMSENAGMSE